MADQRNALVVSGRTVDDAVQQALRRLGLSRAQVDVEVLSEGRAGILGIGATSATVRVTPRGAAPADSSRGEESAAPLPRIDDYADFAEVRRGTAHRAERPAAGPDRGGDRRGGRPGGRDRDRDRDRGRPRDRGPRGTEPELFDLLADPDFEPDEDPVRHAAEVLTDLIHLIGYDARVTSRAPATPMDGLGHASAVLDVEPAHEGDDLEGLIGERGQAMAALQYIVNVIVSRSVEGQHPVTIDIAGYRRRRETALNDLAHRVAEDVRRTRQTVELEAMSPGERRIVHLALSEEPDVFSESHGQGESRRLHVSFGRKPDA